ncbi:unnamed protein product [Amoebophrya sp. A120]|nr:unnamed protein product [Amoebophrya sp. A120]|eukprot:GSA120T00008097001.1
MASVDQVAMKLYCDITHDSARCATIKQLEYWELKDMLQEEFGEAGITFVGKKLGRSCFTLEVNTRWLTLMEVGGYLQSRWGVMVRRAVGGYAY